MPRIMAWSTAALSARAEVADRLVAKGLKLALKPITADISQIVTAATAPAPPPPSAEAPELAPPPTGPAPTVALLGLEGIAATWGAFVDTELFPYVVQTFMDSATDIAGDLTAATANVIMPVGNEYATEYLAAAKNRLKNISDLLWQSTRDELVFGMEQGYDMSQMAAAVKQAAGVAEPRAMVIARTEVISAANAGSIIQMRAVGFEPGTVTKEWLSTHDSRTRPAHEDADGQTVDLDEPFIVGREALDRPLDPNGSPGNTIDCRCAMAFDFVDAPLIAAKDFDESMVKRDSEGKFAKKTGFKLPDLDALSNQEKSDFIKSITPEQWHVMSLEDRSEIVQVGDDLEAIDFDGTLGVAGHIEDLQTSEPDDEVDTDTAAEAAMSKIMAQTNQVMTLTPETWSALSDSAKAEIETAVNEMAEFGLDDENIVSKKLADIKTAAAGDEDEDEVDIVTPVPPKPTAKKKKYKLPNYDPMSIENVNLSISLLTPDQWRDLSAADQEKVSKLAKALTDFNDLHDAHANITALKSGTPTVLTTPTPLGPPKPINTKTVYKDTYADAEVVAVKDHGNARLVWDEAAKKFLLQAKQADGSWQTSVALGKGATYDTFKGDTGWFAPAVATATPVSTAVPSPTPTVTSPLATPGVDGFPDPGSLKSTGKKLGTHGATVYKDQATGKEWLFKPTVGKKKYTAEVDVATAKIQQQVGLVTPKITTMTVGGQFGSLQEMVPQSKPAFPGTFDASKLSKKDLQTLLQHQVLDWFIGNHDSHKGNIVRAPDGTLVGIDKGQAFKFYNGDQLSTDFHINEHPSVYAQLWQQYEQGKVDITDEDLFAAITTIESIQGIDPKTLDEWLKPYYTGAASSGDLLKKYSNSQLKPKSGLTANDPDAFMAAVEERQDKLSQDFATFYALQKIKKAQNAPVAPAVTTSPLPIASPGGPGAVSPGSLLGDPTQVKFTAIGKTYKGLELDMSGYGSMPITDADDQFLGYLKQEGPPTATTWSLTPAYGPKQEFTAPNTNAAFAHAVESVFLGDPGVIPPVGAAAPTVPTGTTTGPVGLPDIPIGVATTTKAGLTASTAPVDPNFGHVVESESDANLMGYLKQVSGTPPLWVYTEPGGKQSAPFVANFLHNALEALGAGKDTNGTSTHAVLPPGMFPVTPGTPLVTPTPAPTANPLSSTSLPSLSAFAPSATPAAPTVAPSLPSTLTHSKKLLNTKTIYKDTHKQNEVVAVNQLGERLIWSENFKKFHLQKIDASGKWVSVAFFGKGEAFKKFGKDTHWFAPNASDQPTGSSAPTPTIAPSPGITPLPPTGAPATIVAPAAPEVQQQAALSGIDVPEELLPTATPSDPTDVPPPPAIPVIKGLNADYSTLDIDQKQKIGFHAQALPTKTAAQNFKGAMLALNATPNVNIAQVLAYLDAKNVKFGGAPNFYTQQIVDWLRTPDGKKAARKIVADAAATSTAPAALPYQKGIDLKPYTIGTPSTTDTHFPAYTVSQMVAMQKSQQPPWTATQEAALKKYTTGYYGTVNDYLRTGVGTDLAKKTAENAQKGMRPLPFPLSVTRGTGTFFGKTQPSLTELQAMVGVTVRDKGFLSTAVQGGGFGGKYRLEIEVPSGTPAAFVDHISAHPGEKELLLAAGLKYQIIEIKGGTYPTVVRMRVVP